MLAERALNKPYYVFRPAQALRRLARAGSPAPSGLARAPLAWGGELEVFPSDAVGASIWRQGVFELAVSEVLARLLDPGELAVDVGANVGYMTALMVSRVGEHGHVISFEPHPELSRVLTANAARAGTCDVTVVAAALSDREGEGRLALGDDFERNRGTATLSEDDGLSVPLERLDDRLAGRHVGVLKIDVEGHELSVLRGAETALAEGRIRDIVFEENRALPTPVTGLLEAAGYELFGLDQRLLGPRLVAPEAPRARPMWEAPTYLATLDPARARARMRRRGWTVLSSRESRRLSRVG